MKGYYIKEKPAGGTEYELRELPKPQPKKGEMLVKVRAASLNRGEILASISLHRADEARPAGGDCAGVVEAVGEGVTKFKAGDEVIGRARGCFSEYVSMLEVQAAPKPPKLSWEEAGAVTTVSVTAYESVSQFGRLKAGETMVVAGAPSGVGVAAVQLGKYLGAKVIGVSRSQAKLDKLKALGMDLGIVAAAGGGFAEKVMEATGGKGANLGVNLVGGSAFPDLVKCAANQGRIAIVGYVDHKHHAEIDLEAVHGSRLQIFGVSNARLPADQRAEAMAGFIRVMLPGIVEGRIKPIVDKAFPFEQLAKAKDYVESDTQLGKVVLRIA